MMKVLGGFGLVAGATYPLRALGVLWRSPHLWGYLIAPILVNLALAIALYGGFLFWGWQEVTAVMETLSAWLDRLIADLPAWLSYLEYLIVGFGYLLRGLLIVGLLLVVGFLLVQFGSVLGSPWYGKLSEQIEKLRIGHAQIVDVGIVRDIWRALLFEVKKLLLAVGIGLGLLFLGLIPGLAPLLATFGGLLIPAILVCLDFFDAPLERRRLRFRQKVTIVLHALPASASFALLCLLLVSIPLLNLLTIPICVAAGTLFVCDRILPKLPQP